MEIFSTLVVIGICLVILYFCKFSLEQRQIDKNNQKNPKKCCMHPDNNYEYDPHHLPNTEQKAAEVSAKDDATKIMKCNKEKERIITQDEIRFRAYMLAEADGFKGDNIEYWLRAEKELKEEQGELGA